MGYPFEKCPYDNSSGQPVGCGHESASLSAIILIFQVDSLQCLRASEITDSLNLRRKSCVDYPFFSDVDFQLIDVAQP